MSSELQKLDEKGFVFLDEASRPYHVRMWGGAPWVFYWHPDKKWVSLREVDQMFVWQANDRALPDEQAELYHQLHRKSQPSYKEQSNGQG